MADTYRDGICCQYGAGEFNISVNGEPGANSSSGECRDVVRECFDGRVAVRAPASTIGSMSRTMATYTYEIVWSLQSLTTGAVVAVSDFDAVSYRVGLSTVAVCLSAWFLATSTSL
jgi:hypothetical protein